MIASFTGGPVSVSVTNPEDLPDGRIVPNLAPGLSDILVVKGPS